MGAQDRPHVAVLMPGNPTPPARGPGTLIPSAQRLVWAAKQALGSLETQTPLERPGTWAWHVDDGALGVGPIQAGREGGGSSGRTAVCTAVKAPHLGSLHTRGRVCFLPDLCSSLPT